MEIASIAIAAVVGVGIGILSGMLGIGGGTVMVPVFKLGFGMSAMGATATSLFAIIPTAISGSITHVRQKTCIPKLGVLAGVGGACLSPVGVQLASISPSWLIMLAAAIVIAYSSITMFQKALQMPRTGAAGGSPTGSAAGDSMLKQSSLCRKRHRRFRVAAELRVEPPAVEPVGDAAATPSDDAPLKRSVYLGLPIGAAAGLVAGYVGVGGGFLMVPLFLSIIGVDMKRASGSSLLAIAILSIPGTVMQLYLGNVAIAIAIAVVVGSVPGAVLGARLTTRIPERELRFLFGGVLLVAAVLLVVQELGIF